MIHRTLVLVVLILQAVCLGAQTAQAEPPGPVAGSAPRPVAMVLSQPVDVSEIEPRPEVARQKGAELDTEAFARWLLEARAQQLASLVQVRLKDAYAKRFRLEPTEAELQPLLAMMEDIPRKVEEDMKQFRQRRLAEIRKKLEEPALDPAERERLTAEIADLGRARPNRDAEILEGNRKMTSIIVQDWKVQRSLYQRHGGRVLVSSFGVVAIDAMQRFLREEEKRGSFEIFDPGLRVAFWKAAADETWADGVATGSDAAEVFATPPWQRVKERRP
jgi:hypothetical protein